MRALNRLVDFVGEAEIVGRDDQIFQCAISRRSRRKRKNSSPLAQAPLHHVGTV